ncbi:MAG: hypothetical protein UW09_C0004G0101 [candidate division TM6 bacterium GW2011_GWF2_43_87]|nr:MAG: hypothetical protein UW09_C0004G0101 [candidate division TM6 bacterium GW2011_GWF2_43_87]
MGYTPFRWACNHGHVKVAKFLIEEGARLDILDPLSNETDLHNACTHGYLKIVKLLINAGVSPDVRDHWGHTPLFQACTKNKIDVIKELIHAGANINTADNESYTPLHEACRLNNLALIRILILAGADTTKKNIHSIGAFDLLSEDSCLQFTKSIVPLKKTTLNKEANLPLITSVLMALLQADPLPTVPAGASTIVPYLKTALNLYKGKRTDTRIPKTKLVDTLELENPDTFLTHSIHYFYTNLDKEAVKKAEKKPSRFDDLRICFSFE